MKPLCSVDSSRQLNQNLLKWSSVTLFSALCFLESTAAGPDQQQPTAYEMLVIHGFPAGLLPQTVINGTYLSNGGFEVSLSGKCSVDIPEAYPVSYSSKITGILSQGRLSDLSGITVKAFFFWWPINEIFVTGKDLVFVIGIASASYPASNFINSPVCGGSSMISNNGAFTA